ncbi:hypothetical protein AB0C70_18075 [Streptomyces sp. NPDC048564]|uniref:hypothetical protein n=1 Tax=unclassified Streptomyces TaxID=2593676 RepID=UPI0034291FB4
MVASWPPGWARSRKGQQDIEPGGGEQFHRVEIDREQGRVPVRGLLQGADLLAVLP